MGTDEIPGNYDAAQKVWVVTVGQKKVPFVLASPNVAELATKTKTVQERDDLAVSLELATKTEVVPERDDFAASGSNLLLELGTKTFKQLERDD